MGNCVGGSSGGENIFKVVNINDDKNLVQKGQMEVTASELIYVDGKSKEDWHWPLKYLRKYGCDGDVFTFEAGRKCPGGEGLYAFETKKASLLFEIVARNINQGDLSPLPDPTAQVTDSTMMNFPPRRNSTVSPTPHGEQPSYTNIDMMGNPLENGNNHTPPHQPAAEPTGPDPKKVMYREVVFDKPPEEHPKPATAPPKSNTSYTQIDFDQTARYNEEMKRGGGALPSTTTPHNRTSSTSTVTSGTRSPTKRIHGKRLNTISTSSSAHDRHARSESSYSSQSSLTESSRDIRTPPKHNGGPRHFSTPDPNNPAPSSSMYQNVNVGVVPEQQYQNVQVGAGEVSQVFDTSTPKPHPQPQPNYCNLSLSATAGGDTPSSDSGRGSGVVILNGDSMMTYAQLQLSSKGSSSGQKPRTKSMSSSGGRSSRDSGPQSSYMQLDFQNTSTSATPTTGKSHAQRSASVSVVPGPSSSSNAPSTTTSSGSLAAPPTTLAQQQSIPEEDTPTSLPAASAMPSAPVDETKVTYGVLNFPQMEALRVLSKEREQAIEQEQREREQREKDKEKSASHKKKK